MLSFPFDKRVSILVLSFVCCATGVLNAQEGVNLTTPTLGFLGKKLSPDGKGYAYIYDSAGNVIKTISLEDKLPRPGRLGNFALLSGPWNGATQTLDIYDASGNHQATFEIDGFKETSLGKQAVLLQPRRDHEFFLPYDIKFLDLTGKLLEAHLKEGCTLHALEQFESDRWVALYHDKATDSIKLDHFDSIGRLVWSYDTKRRPSPSPIVAVSDDGSRAAIGLFTEDAPGSTLTLLDGTGKVVLEGSPISTFSQAAFSPDGVYLALAGNDYTQLRKASDGSLVWSRRTEGRLGGGDACPQWSSDTSSFYCMTRQVDDDGEIISHVLTQYSTVGPEPILAKVLSEPLESSPLRLLVDDPANITVIMVAGRLTVSRF